MRINSRTKIEGTKTILVPYEAVHVPKYHKWMQSKELQLLTASEPLSLEEEYEMQSSWREDEDKCTFIILDKCIYNKSKNEIESMIGDTNIFITDQELSVGEIEIMIAEDFARGKKCGWEAVIIMLTYGIEYINLKTYIAKISMKNDISIKMFKKLGFLEESLSQAFQEITLRKNVDEKWKRWLKDQIQGDTEIY